MCYVVFDFFGTHMTNHQNEYTATLGFDEKNISFEVIPDVFPGNIAQLDGYPTGTGIYTIFIRLWIIATSPKDRKRNSAVVTKQHP